MNMKATRHIYWFKISATLLSCSLLIGCFESNRSTNQICENYPLICNKLNLQDGQCRHERNDLIWIRLETQKKPTDLNTFDELIVTQKYAKCMELAAQIETTTLKTKRTLRTEALFHALNSIERIEKELKTSYQPSIIYYRWSQGDNAALEQFLKLEETEYLDTPELQLALATYYVDKDKFHTNSLLLKSLSLYDGRSGKTRDNVIPEVLKTLATSNHSLGKLDDAYLWALIGKKLGVRVANEAKLKLLYPMSDEKRQYITQLADTISTSIEDGNFDITQLTPTFTPKPPEAV